MQPDSDGRRSASHANPVTQAGFTMIPNTVMLRKDLSPVAKLVYGYLKHLAWRDDSDDVEPSRERIAEDLAIGVKIVTKAMRELQKAAVAEGDEDDGALRLVASVRRGQGLTNRYVVQDPERSIRPSGKDEEESPESPDRPFPISLGVKTEPKTKSLANARLSERPPKICLIDGRNLPLDALVEECAIDPAGKTKVLQAVAALNGKVGTSGGVLKQGIVHLYWIEATRWAEAAGREDRLRELYGSPMEFAESLAAAIRRKCALYRASLDHAMLTPTALQKWWLDLERQRPKSRGMTPAEMEAFRG